MISKITKLKKFGIFRDFLWSSNVPDFSRFNLIYGWNKSGKTTLSRIFSACEKKTTEFKQYPNGGEFEMQTSRGTSMKHSDCQNTPVQIRVFNRDFVEDNVSFDPLNPSNPIVYVGEEDIESNKKLKELRGKSAALSQTLEFAQKDRQKNEKAEDDFRKSTARTIKDLVGNLKINDKYRDYDKSNVKDAIENIGVSKFKKLSDDDFEKLKKLIGGEPLQSQSLFSKSEINFSFNEGKLEHFSDIHDKVTSLLQRQIVADFIDRFKNDSELNKWAQHGFELHNDRNERDKCLFCQNKLPEGFLESLSKHFSDDYKKLQGDIGSFIQALAALKNEQISEKNTELYADFQGSYRDSAKELNIIVRKLNFWIDSAMQKLNAKQETPLSMMEMPDAPKDFKKTYDEAIDELNTAIANHNSRVENHEQEVKNAKGKLEGHLIAVAIAEQDYVKIKRDYDLSIEAERKEKKEQEENNRQILELEMETSNIGKAVPKINKHLEEFFGRKEIQLELDDLKKGYVIKRDGDAADNLSEGEKNAIAFCYFIVKTQEKGSKIQDSTIVIDDPISSFDSHFIHHCFSLIKNHFKDVKQLIITTHNFEFFNLVKEWFERKNQEVERSNTRMMSDADKKPVPCQFYMIENTVNNEKRCASLLVLEETLRKFKSEYHFLFAKLRQFVGETAPDYADFYTIGNIARRFLEIYVNFKIPTTGDLASKVDHLDAPGVSDVEKGKVYKLVQEFSHGSDPMSTNYHMEKSESRNAITVLLKIVEKSDPKHFQLLEKCCTNSQ